MIPAFIASSHVWLMEGAVSWAMLGLAWVVAIVLGGSTLWAMFSKESKP